MCTSTSFVQYLPSTPNHLLCKVCDEIVCKGKCGCCAQDHPNKK